MILLSEIRLLQKQYILKALPVKAVNGQDERRISCAAIDSPARSCSAVIKAGKPQGCLPASFDFDWPQIEANFDRYLQSPELLQTLVFCDTILILRKRGVPNNRWNINIIAKVFPVKSPQIRPYISEFAEWEWFQRPGKAWNDWVFEGLRPFVATIWQHFFIIHKKRANWFWLVS